MTRDVAIGGAVCVALVAFAFVAAPSSCEWGLGAYVLAGVVCTVALAVLPMALRTGMSSAMRALVALAFAGAGIGVWVVGLFAANVRILCRLF